MPLVTMAYEYNVGVEASRKATLLNTMVLQSIERQASRNAPGLKHWREL